MQVELYCVCCAVQACKYMGLLNVDLGWKKAVSMSLDKMHVCIGFNKQSSFAHIFHLEKNSRLQWCSRSLRVFSWVCVEMSEIHFYRLCYLFLTRTYSVYILTSWFACFIPRKHFVRAVSFFLSLDSRRFHSASFVPRCVLFFLTLFLLFAFSRCVSLRVYIHTRVSAYVCIRACILPCYFTK